MHFIYWRQACYFPGARKCEPSFGREVTLLGMPAGKHVLYPGSFDAKDSFLGTSLIRNRKKRSRRKHTSHLHRVPVYNAVQCQGYKDFISWREGVTLCPHGDFQRELYSPNASENSTGALWKHFSLTSKGKVCYSQMSSVAIIQIRCSLYPKWYLYGNLNF